MANLFKIRDLKMELWTHASLRLWLLFFYETLGIPAHD